jgi:very-short-patch-repair endonuclease
VTPTADKAGLFAAAWKVCGDEHVPEREFGFHETRRWRLDFAFRAQRVGVEVDGNAWHVRGGGRHGTDADRDKINELAARLWVVFHFSPKQLEDDPARCCELVKRALAYRDLEER